MLKKIFILSAGKLKNKNSHTLKGKHKRRLQRIGHTLSCITHEINPILISSHPASEASCLTALKAGAFDTSVIKVVDQPLEQLNQLDENVANVLIVLSEDHLLEKLNHLWKPTFKKGTCLTLHYAQKWDIFQWAYCEIKNLIDPDQLPNYFPYITDKGIEQRSRPSYYYQLSAALPYRYNNDIKEVLLIPSNGNWNLPISIIEPDCSPQTSAIQKAETKAGVQGELTNDSIGTYNVQKWDAEIPVSVFPMQVNNSLNDKNYHRKWYSIHEAKEMVQNNELSHLIDLI